MDGGLRVFRASYSRVENGGRFLIIEYIVTARNYNGVLREVMQREPATTISGWSIIEVPTDRVNSTLIKYKWV